MMCLKTSLIFLLLIAVRAEKSLSDDNLSLPEGENKDKLSDKRWTDYVEPHPFQSALSGPSTLKVQSQKEDQERAKEEKTFKDFLAYEAIQSVLVNALKPKPILDTAEDSEKFAPNDGSKTRPLGDLIVKGSETLSRALNTVIDVPKKALNKLSAGATQALNQLGAYLVGL